MTTRMLIDARHHEETRVAVLKGNRIEEFDFESADHKQIKGNIYLAKVTRVEPSLQAAFVDFGGNRHGFLAFSEIHPDYYQIPKQDREALLAEEAAHAEEEAALRAAEEAEDDAEDDPRLDSAPSGDGLDDDGDGSEALADELAGEDGVHEVDTSEKDEVATLEGGQLSNLDEDEEDEDEDEAGIDGEDSPTADESGERAGEEAADEAPRRGRGRRQGRAQAHGNREQADALRDKRLALRRRYKIQDVIHRRQVLLVQVVKEERGNKGAALTTYLSLAGRYCVLMPNSSHGGGISRKISSAADRKRLKSIIAEMNLPKSMGCIVRTAGLSRTKPEIKRDFDYLARLWDEIRERTLRSSAPAAIHSDSDLIKRAIRDIYNRDIEEVVVEGEAGFRAARDFMKLLMPTHERRVKQYADAVPLFQRYGAEDQLTAMYDPVVQLRSGGYLVINPTEALVSIDINSGRSTKEHGIEATALNTNLEAAREIARQLRLRDMAGLIVIDFIDMEYGANVRKVEKCMKEALKNDRARIQIGRISGFGLMEMSRQRLRTGVLEATTRSCPHCDGTGLVRTASSAGLSALRLIEDEAAKGRGSVISLYASQEAAIYLLNAKRADLAEIEARYGVAVEVLPEGENEGAKMRAMSSGPRPEFVPRFEPIAEPEDDLLDEEEEDFAQDGEIEDERDERDEDEATGDRAEAGGDRGSDDRGGRKRRKRRRGGRGREREAAVLGSDGEREEEGPEEFAARTGLELEGTDDEQFPTDATGEEDTGDEGRGRRRRSRRRRGGRGREGATADQSLDEATGEPTVGDEAPVDQAAGDEAIGDDVRNDEPFAGVAGDGADANVEVAETGADPIAEAVGQPGEETAGPDEAEAAAPPRRRRKAEPDSGSGDDGAPATDEVPKPARRSRRKPAAASEDSGPAADADGEPVAKPRARRKKLDPAEPPFADVPLAQEPLIGELLAAGSQPDAALPNDTTAAPGSGEAPAAPAPDQAERPAAAPATEGIGSDAADLQTAEGEAASEPPRRGWWQRTFGA